MLIALFVLALLIRTFWLFIGPIRNPERVYIPDSYEYEQLAKNLIEQNKFSKQYGAPFIPDNKRTPIYPIFIAITYVIFGQQPIAVCFIQALISSITVLLTFFIGYLLHSKWVGFIAAIIILFSPFQIIYNGYLMSETLYTALLTMFFLLTILVVDKKISYFNIFLAGSVLGIATLCRPVSLYLPVPLVAVFAIILKNYKLKKILFFIIGFSVVIFPWMTRNYFQTNNFRVTTINSINLKYYEIATFKQHLTGKSIDETWNEYNSYVTTSNLVEYLYLISENPIEYIKIRFFWLFRLLFDPGNGVLYFLGNDRFIGSLAEPKASLGDMIFSDLKAAYQYAEDFQVNSGFFRGIILKIFLVAYLSFLSLKYLFLLIGIISRNFTNLKIKPLIVIILLYFFAVSGSVSSVRFSLPIEPIINVLAAIGLKKTIDWFQYKSSFGCGSSKFNFGKV